MNRDSMNITNINRASMNRDSMNRDNMNTNYCEEERDYDSNVLVDNKNDEFTIELETETIEETHPPIVERKPEFRKHAWNPEYPEPAYPVGKNYVVQALTREQADEYETWNREQNDNNKVHILHIY